MKDQKLLFLGLSTLLILSFGLVAFSISAMIDANERVEQLLTISEDVPSGPTVSEPLSIDAQILDAQNKLRQASNGIRTRKIQIRRHSFSAIRAIDSRSETSLREAKELMDEISENSIKILKRNEEIEAESLHLYSLYQRKIEKILEAKKAQEESTFSLPFWIGLFGLLATMSGIVLAWRKDRLDHNKDRRELTELQHKLEQTMTAA